MFYTKTHKVVELLVLGSVCLAAPTAVGAAPAMQLSGAITGVVTNAAGAPQMGAAVVLYNHQDRVFERVLTNIRGEFRFSQLFPDLYSIRVSLALYVPALKKNILVQPGMRSILNVNLTTLFSSIQIGYPQTDSGTFMSDDWKWILRGASSTRPVLRFTDSSNTGSAPGSQPSLFSDLRGVLQLSAGDGPLVTGIGSEADMGTAFALAASVFGNNQLQFSGDLGYGAQTGVPVTAFRTSYRSDGLEASVTMRQLYLPSREAPLTGTDGAGIPALRSMSASVDGHSDLSDQLSVQYGSTLDSVAFFSDHLNYFSPYVRFVYTLDDRSYVSFAYTSGNARPDLADNMAADSDDLQRDLSTVGLFPRISLLGGAPKVQRGNEYELAYSRKMGSRRFELSGYRESVTNAALSLVAPDSFYTGGDLLPDLFTGNAIFNAGNYQNTGYSAAITQDLGQHFSGTVIYGTTGGLTAPGGELVSGSPDELRSMIRAARTQTVAGRISATLPRFGTHLIASYEWMGDSRLLTPGRLYSTQSLHPMPGLNIYIRQPVPGLSMLPWRTEATIDLRNLLAQGYLPLGMIGGQEALLVQTPRALRGGLSFIF
jgi:hypothetical protein